MRSLGEIHHRPGLRMAGRTLRREAVRAVIANGRQLLMVHSRVGRDYKFPGGGVEPGETPLDALRREVLEECGRTVVEIGTPLGSLVEYDRAIEPSADVFRMVSTYVFCQVDDVRVAQSLDDYERDLGFEPAWVDVDAAHAVNEAALRSPDRSRWVSRELLVLGVLSGELGSPRPGVTAAAAGQRGETSKVWAPVPTLPASSDSTELDRPVPPGS
jgi:8-oxo-dGTP pyrophosphatase MutT (NUDIX family)